MTGKQIDKLLEILDRAVKVAERWADKEYPVANEQDLKDIGISRVGEQSTPQSVEEYKAYEPSNLERRLRGIS